MGSAGVDVGAGMPWQSFLLAFYIVKFLITFCIIVAMSVSRRLRLPPIPHT